MTAILLGVAPVFGLIALGWALKARRFLMDEAWRPIERLVYFVLYPGFLIPTIWNADFSGLAAGPVGLASVSAVGIVALAAVLLKPLIRLPDASFTSVFQGVIRWNAFVFLPVALSVFGRDGAALGAVVVGSLIPFINILCVLVLSRWGEGQAGVAPRALARSLATNPVFMSCVVGLALNLLNVPRIPGVFEALQMLGAAGVPLGLIVAGSGLSFRGLALRPVTLASVTAVKMLALPVLMFLLAGLYGGDRVAQGVALLCGCAPGAAASYVLARQMGGDAPLMAGITAATTLAAAAVMPLMLILFGYG
ncbi:AEC family transporter [Brevundimonas sp. 2R-24]|uniref:AEC family transporter n=1 Tax=Peiella sedimenti TaxID=3061083 RepID=A0ABT8SQJ9_9CAUL|nr:AEC family transporter [Caulobacteraceae bacterium XZ-24]